MQLKQLMMSFTQLNVTSSIQVDLSRSIFKQRPLKLGGVKVGFTWQITLFQSPKSEVIIFDDFMFKKHFKRPKTGRNIVISLLDLADKGPLANIKIQRRRRQGKLLISGRSGTQYVAMETKLVYSYCGVYVIESLCKKTGISDTNWLRYIFFIRADQDSVEFVTSSLR